MTLVIENVREEFLPSVKAFSKAINAKCRVEKPKLSKFESDILKEREEMLKHVENGTARIFKDHQEFKKALDNGEV